MLTVDRTTLRQKLERNDNFLLIDVLPKDEFKKDHIEGSINIPVEDKDFVKRVERKARSKNHEIVVYCGGLDCSASHNAAQKLKDADFTNVKTYEGGMAEWKEYRKSMAA